LSGFGGSIAVADGNEAPRDDIKLLAENLARVEATMATKEELQAAVGRLEEEFKTGDWRTRTDPLQTDRPVSQPNR